MSLVIAETNADPPLTDEVLFDNYRRVEPCLTARNIRWHRSFLSSDRHRMICVFEAPDAESVREAYRRQGLPSRLVWTSSLIRPEPNKVLDDVKALQVIEGSYPPLSASDWSEISHNLSAYCAAHDIEWRHSYMSLDRKKVIYELNAPTLELVQGAPHKSEVPFSRVWSARVLSN
ncbi:MAG: DUF4242 domain-containing protein [Oscillatoriophycideae cyanobacterium NC_groundwater_1537_Pr4_S-0.65um_50_18]|nr:DUF4242 domain-containing protein [Oscillatoriophycideae cyanobacterium NC_groundwater_1537_Pr4_S-0.65um_50_18]